MPYNSYQGRQRVAHYTLSAYNAASLPLLLGNGGVRCFCIFSEYFESPRFFRRFFLLVRHAHTYNTSVGVGAGAGAGADASIRPDASVGCYSCVMLRLPQNYRLNSYNGIDPLSMILLNTVR